MEEVASPLSTAATFTPAVSTTVAKLRATRDALRTADVLAANMVKDEEEVGVMMGWETEISKAPFLSLANASLNRIV